MEIMLKLLKTKKFLAAIGSLVALGIVLTAVLTLSKGNKNTPATTPTPTQAVDMTDYGIAVTGTPANNDTIVVIYQAEERGTIRSAFDSGA
ncbi:MAG: hypothetical protein J6S78_05995, partial [Lachnospiraceae bacterium]|nr:hypothetical protein [Lachnospiraceae bacterium]